jgi:hypothetical protein
MTCSARKRADEGPLPARERYDGPLWQVLRAYQREQPIFAADLAVHVLSAEFGLIPDDHPVPPYDQTMTDARADELRAEATARLAELLGRGPEAVCLALSQRYLRALAGWEGLVPPGVAATVTDGPLGTKLGQLRAWLEGRVWAPPPEQPERLVAGEHPRGAATVGRVRIALTRDEALARARQALEEDGAGAERYRDWCVLIDGRPVAPKWLVSLLSGLPVSAFSTPDARRALLALGFDVERVRPD